MRNEYKKTFRTMLENYVREEDKENFLLSLLKTTNQYTGSAVWGAVWELLKEDYGYDDGDLFDLLK